MHWSAVLEPFIAFLIVVLPPLGGYLVVLLRKNTQLTIEMHRDASTELAELRDRVQAQAAILDAYRDFAAYVKSTPEGKRLTTQYTDRRRTIVYDEDLVELERRATQPPG